MGSLKVLTIKSLKLAEWENCQDWHYGKCVDSPGILRENHLNWWNDRNIEIAATSKAEKVQISCIEIQQGDFKLGVQKCFIPFEDEFSVDALYGDAGVERSEILGPG